jgi:tRNA(His) 5'-end guanylyltransferase
LDAARNSVQMVGQANFSHSELQNKTCNMIQDMLHEQKGINWNDFPTHMKRGSCCVRRDDWEGCPDFHDTSYPRKKWVVDTEIPMFKGEDRNYIDQLITFD